jgi:DNA-binding transcriptional MerR regulator
MKAYSTREVAELLGLSTARVRALVRSGIITPQRDANTARAAFTFQDLVLLRTAKGLIDAKVPARRINKALQALAAQLPTDRPLSAVRVQIDGDRVIVRDSNSSWEPESGQTVLDF